MYIINSGYSSRNSLKLGFKRAIRYVLEQVDVKFAHDQAIILKMFVIFVIRCTMYITWK